MKIQVVLDGKAYVGDVTEVGVNPQPQPDPIPQPQPLPIPPPPPSNLQKLNQRINSGFFGIEVDVYVPGDVHKFCIPLGEMAAGIPVKRLKVCSVNMGTINEADVDMLVISPSGQIFTSNNPNSSDETVDIRSQSYGFSNYAGQYIESGDWILTLTAKGSGGVKIYWIFY